MARRLLIILRRLLPYLGALAVVSLAAGLVATIWLTTVEVHWLAFLAGVLIAASLALASRVSNNAWTIARRTAQLALAREKLAAETLRRERAEQAAANVNRAARYVDEMLPAMLVYVDAERRIQYHNGAYAEWTEAAGAHLEGRTLVEAMAAEDWSAVAPRIDEAFRGVVVNCERSQKAPQGHATRLSELYVPRFGPDGKVAGVFCVLADVTRREDRAAEAQAQYSSSIAGELTGWRDVAQRLVSAIEGDEFALYFQTIVPADRRQRATPFNEMLLRLQEEEDNLMPPGAFLPLAAQHNLLPDLDMWVVRHVVGWAAASKDRQDAIYSINVSADTIADPRFRACVRERVSRDAGPTLCFEFNEADASADLEATKAFVRELRALGCRFALSGFGRDPVSFTLPREVPFDYIKIDASLVLAAERGPVELARIKAINRVAHSLSALTVAECVESESTRQVLAQAGVDFLQGFGISRPRPLRELVTRAAA